MVDDRLQLSQNVKQKFAEKDENIRKANENWSKMEEELIGDRELEK